MRDNPIRKLRTIYQKPVREGDIGIAHVGYWYAVCPDCGEKVNALTGEYGSTRKKAKDNLHKHKTKEHAGPGGHRTSLRA